MDASTKTLLHSVGVPYYDHFVTAASKYGLPLDLLLRQAKQESGFKPDLVSKAGAIGVMQLMPDTAAELKVNPWHVEQNIDGGARYLKQMLDRYGGDMNLALAAYNAGPTRVDQYVKAGRPLPAETDGYIKSIAAMRPFAPAPPAAKPVRTQALTAADMPQGLLSIPGM